MAPPSDEPQTESAPAAGVDSSVLSGADVGVAHLASGGDVAAVNDAFVRLTTHSRDAVLGRPFPDLLSARPSPLESILSQGPGADRSLSLTLPVETSDGDVVALDAVVKPVRDAEDGGLVVVLYQSDADDAEHWQSFGGNGSGENAPAKAFGALANALSDGIIVLDADSHIQYANPAVERILGFTPDELIGGSKLSIIPERLRETHLAALDRYLETGQRNIDWEYVELPGQHKDGHEVELGISLNDFFFGGDRYFVGLFRDVSARKEAERALRERERELNRYREYTDDILDAIADVFYVVDREGSLQRWNRTILEVTGYSEAEVESMHALDFFAADDREAILNAIAEGFDTGRAQVDADIATKDGETIPYEFVASTLEDPDGERVLAGIGRDVTEREESRRKLEESNERLEQFAYAASHDLQEPLRMVTSYLGLLENRYAEDLDDDAEEFIEFAVDGADRMREMIEGLLKYSRVDTQGDPMGAVDLDAVLADVREDLGLRIEESGATVRAGDLPTVEGDGGQLRQVFQNLLSNAIEYSGDEPPAVEITAERAGDRWRVAVRDEGIGIDPTEQDRVFEVFQRLHSSDESAGTGLGLAVCRRIVERHGGDIWVDSAPGEGSTFYFTLPDADGEAQ